MVLFLAGQAWSDRTNSPTAWVASNCAYLLHEIDAIYLELEARPGPPPFVDKLITSLIKHARSYQKELDLRFAQEDLSSFEREVLKLAQDLISKIISLLESLRDLIRGQMSQQVKEVFLKTRTEAWDSLHQLKNLKSI
ncbi:MAG: hypothetical protein JRD68_08675 [Deltaproteobacteria bacterium]|nr:hypothetical protein [Deltaproteobacteria bacterium]